ncbi:hypothetical protein [Labilibaculum sp.]|uniref:hypothetical protein n=1 Tax=Labilibaculum sp. TaxID=2060723 RepID=UPI003567E7AD
MRLSKPNNGETKIDNRTIAQNSQGEIVNLDDFKLAKAIKFYERFSFSFSKYSGGKAHLTWGVNANDYLKRTSNGVSGKYRLTSKLFTNEELNSYINEFGQGCFLSWYLEVTSKYTTYPVFVVEKEFNCDLPRTLEGETGAFLPLASARLFMNENNELDQYKTQAFKYYDDSIPAEDFVRPYYREYKDYSTMLLGYASIPSGQIVRVLDNSDAPEPTEGWAVYQLDYNNLVNKGFKLVSLQPKEAEETQSSVPDGVTVEPLLKDDQLRVIDALPVCSLDVSILKDFDMSIEYVKITEQIRFNLTNGNESIPCKQGRTEATFGVKYLAKDLTSVSSLLKNSIAYIAYISEIRTDGVIKMRLKTGYGSFPDLDVQENEILIGIVKVPVPDSLQDVDTSKIVFHKLWKKALVPAEQRIVVPEASSYILDEVTLFETTLSEETKIFAPALCQTHNANFRILEDFDFTYSVGKTYTGDKTFLRVAPIGGLRNIPIMDNGIRRYMSIAQESIIMPDLFNTNFVNEWKYFTLTATVSDSDGAVNPLSTEYETDGSAMLVTPFVTNGSFRFMQIGVKFNADGETVDFQKDLKTFKYWKNALAPFSELWAEKITP